MEKIRNIFYQVSNGILTKEEGFEKIKEIFYDGKIKS